MKEITLKDTTEMMQSSNYKERFKAEDWQLAVRFNSLQEMLTKWDDGILEFSPTCPRSTYSLQAKAMSEYMSVLEARAVMENVDLFHQVQKCKNGGNKNGKRNNV